MKAPKARVRCTDAESSQIQGEWDNRNPDAPIVSTQDLLAQFGVEERLLTSAVDRGSESAAPAYGQIENQPADSKNVPQLLGDFVRSRFLPEYVAPKTSAGKSHFRAMLKYIFSPEQVASMFSTSGERERSKVATIANWPFLDSLRLSEVTPQHIERLIRAAEQAGYSTQTLTHIRNVIRAIYAHALKSGCHGGSNPADHVTLPAMARKEPHRLTLMELKQVLPMMRYPEKYLALFAVLTNLNVAEMCGLQWKNVNVSNEARNVDGESLPARTFAVKNKSYRGEFTMVVGSRRRVVPASDLLCALLHELRARKRFIDAEDFVFASQAGTPIHPENIAARRLKAIGKAMEMPWLSWYVFQRTRADLQSEFGKQLHKELERALFLEVSASGALRLKSART